ncbi:hypothetical protein S40285_04836 [Stachybotrys chlorohalonatus IBT 40285]|uniref:Uncharacterized protein n=1 Tax=Stachybotrys chlorohalonatus (strain IBT 40285) TaxID=1283841 RepID=A0A084QA83_STAC4|nr:hypothetical protein S40285_04836 [Stachybotrys chlorohalonata IBT 40285]
MAEANPISLILPSKYAPKTSGPPLPASAPDLDWMTGTWTVTHSTLSMWRSARNVRITYALLPAKSDLRPRMDDLVEYEPTSKEGVLKNVQGVDTQADKGWNWKGKGLLFFVGSHWEILGWGEAQTPDGARERWAVTYFAPTLFTKEGLDIYCDRKEGLSEQTYSSIMEALKKLDAKHLVDLVMTDMQPVEIRLPWVEK